MEKKVSQLDPVQIAALNFSHEKTGVGFFLEQGLGKTLVALTEFAYLYKRGFADRMVVICPNTFKRGWADEVIKHGFDFDVHIWSSSKKIEAADFMNRRHVDMHGHHHPPVMIINYDAARRGGILMGLGIWVSRGKTYLVLDESIQIKGPKSLQTRAAHHLAPLCKFQRLLTGRPQTQGPHDLWGQLRAIGLFRHTNFYSFRGRYCIMGGWKDKEVLAAQNTQELAAHMAPVVFQAKKAHWLPALPRKDYTIRDYKMPPPQQRQYNQMERQFLLEIESGVISVEIAITKYMKLAQIQCGFIYDEERIVHELVALEDNPRINLLLQILEEEVAGKVCVVYRHRAMLPILEEALRKWRPAWIKGGMKPDEVAEQKARFNEDPACRIILLQCDAAKYGHTLLGGPGEDDRCRTMIFFENSYSADTRDQIEDRIHRRGQTGESVLYIDLSGSELDRSIVKALQRKDALYRSVFKNLRAHEPAGGQQERVA
jgi:SNF2 family DNA or RNA helicase